MAAQSTMKNRSHENASGDAIPWIPKTCLGSNELNSWTGMTSINVAYESHPSSEEQPAQVSQKNEEEKEDRSWAQWSIMGETSPFCSVHGSSPLPFWKLPHFPSFQKCWANKVVISRSFKVLIVVESSKHSINS